MPDPVPARRRRKFFLLRTGIVVYIVVTGSLCYVSILEGLRWAPPFAFAGSRTVLGGGVLLAAAKLFGQPFVPERKHLKWVPIVALTATTLTFGSMFLSPHFAGAGLPVVLGNMQPIFIVFIAWIFLRERITGLQLGALLAACFGMLLILLPAVFSGSEGSLAGAFSAVVTSLSAATGSVLVRWIRPSRSLLSFTAWQLVLGGAVLLIVSAIIKEPAIQWNGKFIGLLLFLGILNSAAFTIAWFWLLQIQKAGEAAIYLFLIPVFGLFWAWILQGEIPSILLLSGAAIILGAVILKDCEGFRQRLRCRRRSDEK